MKIKVNTMATPLLCHTPYEALTVMVELPNIDVLRGNLADPVTGIQHGSNTQPTSRNISSIPNLMGPAQPPPHQALGDWPQPRSRLQPAKARSAATSTAISISGRAAQAMT